MATFVILSRAHWRYHEKIAFWESPGFSTLVCWSYPWSPEQHPMLLRSTMRFAVGSRAEGDPNFEAGDALGKGSGFNRRTSPRNRFRY